MRNISTESADGKIFKSSFSKGVELHSWSIRNPKGYKKLKIKAPHFHNEFQIGYLKKGLIENNYRNRNIILPPNELYIIEPQEIHSEYLVHEKEVCFDFIFIPIYLIEEGNIELLDKSKQSFEDLVLDNKALNFQLINKLQAIFNSYKGLSTQLERELSLIDFVTVLIDIKANQKEKDLKNNSKKIIDNLKEYMNENIFTAISLDQLSKEMAVSKFHLGRLFLSETNMTIHKYLMNLKICKAKELLNKNHSIGDVASKLLFTDKSHFIKCFKRLTSQRPGDFCNY
ncbi:AraC family transcriptional regulator [Parasediminibacterium sp. JCM 36343]|uniref:AraC family transcriptional regulator n=1 Tax=Parasediminibacterium sp. JCM 36343 TaxID=3374279 RepID=UPI00397C437B